jgi:hypothetical protein
VRQQLDPDEVVACVLMALVALVVLFMLGTS